MNFLVSETGVTMKCDEGYHFRDSLTEVELHCVDNKWVTCNENLQIKLICQPICNIGCKNNGSCSQPNKCNCSPGYSGNYCQLEKCIGEPPQVPNSKLQIR